MCGKPGVCHIIWGKYGSFACAECEIYLHENEYEFIETHPITPGCTDPIGLWFPEEKTCRPPLRGETTGVIILG